MIELVCVRDPCHRTSVPDNTITRGMPVMDWFTLVRRGLCKTCWAAETSPTARHSDPDTSHAAARLASIKAGTNRERALMTLRAHPDGLTDFDLAALTGIAQTSVGVRRGELVKMGLVTKTSIRRASPSGAAAIVWRASRTR